MMVSRKRIEFGRFLIFRGWGDGKKLGKEKDDGRVKEVRGMLGEIYLKYVF